MEAVQVERRRERARLGRFRIRNAGEEPVHSRFEVLSPSGARYEVELRDPTSRGNGCTCPDYESNLLGTCKHIEAVLYRLRRTLKGPARSLLREPSPRPHVFLYYGAEVEVRILRPPRMEEGLASALGAFFDEGGRLRGDPARTFRALEARIAEASLPVAVSEDARRFVEGLEERRRAARERETLEVAIGSGREKFDWLRAPLYPYQVRGALHLALGGRAILGDEMGLGKTVQAIAACEWLRRTKGIARVLVVCPASLKHQWAREIGRFTDAAVTVVEGGRARRKDLYRTGSFFTVVNYELVRHDARILADPAIRFDLVILDEAQRIKNWRAKTSDAVKRLRRKSPRAFVLTGTPLENNLDEIYSVLQFVDPRVLGPLWAFNERFYAFDADGKVVGVRNLEEIRRRIAPVFLRRRKEEVALELPEKVENTYFVAMSPEQDDLYREHEEAVGRLLAILKRRPLTPKEKDLLLKHLQMMRMACDTPFILDRRVKVAPKLEELEAILEELVLQGGRKALVFSEWERMTALAAERLVSRGIGFERLHGSVPTNRRGALLDRFSGDPSCRVLLSTDAGGLGLNLQAASVVVHLDLPWNPARYDQRVGRALRIGQRETVQVVRLISQGTIEERMLDTLARKRTLFESVVGGEGALSEITFPSRREAQISLLSGLVAPGKNGPTPDPEPAREAPRGGPKEEKPVPEPVLVPKAKPADEFERLRERVAAALQGNLESVERASSGALLVVVRGDAAAARASLLPAIGATPFAVLDSASYEALRPSLATRTQPREKKEDEAASRRARLLERAEEKLEAARCLLGGGLAAEAVLRSAEAAEEALRAALAEGGDPPRGPALLAAAYEAARSGRLARESLEIWGFVRDMRSLVESGGPASPDLAREALEAAQSLREAAAAVSPLRRAPGARAGPAR
ncbi:MAG: DEAD/DEAH box helicase [Planctomycetes bacterium]|nr:DEAD/DEAH box helicase [Planctomycetota bacterium]